MSASFAVQGSRPSSDASLARLPGLLATEASQESLPELLNRAALARRNGDYELAARLYGQALERHPAEIGDVALAAAEAALASQSASTAHDYAAQAFGATPGRSEAVFIQAQSWLDRGDPTQALASLKALPSDHPLAGYAAFWSAELHASAGNDAASRAAYERALTQPTNRLWRALAARRAGDSHLRAGSPAVAVSLFESAAAAALQTEADGTPYWFDGELVRLRDEARRSGVLLALANALHEAGSEDRAIGTLVELITSYPSSSAAASARERLFELGEAARLSAYWHGRVLYHSGRPSNAIDGLRFFVDNYPEATEAPDARYYLGLTRRNGGDTVNAIGDLKAVADLYPEHALAPEALFQAARLVERTQGAEPAIAAYLRVAGRFPQSEQAAGALLRAGWLQLNSGDAAAARSTWGQLGRDHGDPSARAQGLFWLGRGQLGLGEFDQGTATLRAATAAAPFSYAGARAADLAAAGLGAEPYTRNRATSIGAQPPTDMADCTTWIQSWSDAVPATVEPAALIRARMLLGVGQRAAAQVEALDAASDLRSQPASLHQLARGLADLSLHPASIYATTKLAGAGPGGTVSTAPPCLQRLVYPLPFSDLVQDNAQRYSLDPYLLLSLLRQESWFGEHASSGAAARGLSQVIPATAKEIAQGLSDTNFTLDDLYRPRVSITFGAWYLATQYRAFDQRALLALAAYNGGPGSVLRWRGADRQRDPDDFVEAIDFNETRSYVRLIYETYTRYRALYG